MDIVLKKVFNGRYNVSVIENDEYIGPTISRGYEWDGWMRQVVKKYYKPETDILDIGANIGYNSLMFSDYGPVHSFEPVFYEIINMNIRANALNHTVSVYPIALSNEDTESVIYIPERGFQSDPNIINYGATSMYKSDDIGGTPFETTTKKLDDVYEGHPSVIKIDVEGHELQVLQGALETIKKYMPMIMVEIIEFEGSPVYDLLISLGYNKPIECPEKVYVFEPKSI